MCNIGGIMVVRIETYAKRREHENTSRSYGSAQAALVR